MQVLDSSYFENLWQNTNCKTSVAQDTEIIIFKHTFLCLLSQYQPHTPIMMLESHTTSKQFVKQV